MAFKIIGPQDNKFFDGREYKTLAAARTARARCFYARDFGAAGLLEADFEIVAIPEPKDEMISGN